MLQAKLSGGQQQMGASAGDAASTDEQCPVPWAVLQWGWGPCSQHSHHAACCLCCSLPQEPAAPSGQVAAAAAADQTTVLEGPLGGR